MGKRGNFPASKQTGTNECLNKGLIMKLGQDNFRGDTGFFYGLPEKAVVRSATELNIKSGAAALSSSVLP